MKSQFHMKGWAPRLALRKRFKKIRKWPIKMITAPFPTKAGLTTPTFCEEIWIRICARWAGYASVIPNLCLTNKRPFALNNIDKDVKGSKGHYPAKILTKRLMRVRNVKKKCLNIFGGLFWKFLFSTFITVSQAYYSFFNFPLYYQHVLVFVTKRQYSPQYLSEHTGVFCSSYT